MQRWPGSCRTAKRTPAPAAGMRMTMRSEGVARPLARGVLPPGG
jgi:hypothetical protein